MKTLKSKFVSIKNHVARNRAQYGFVAGAATMYYATNHARSSWNEFLEEKDLTDEFYAPEA